MWSTFGWKRCLGRIQQGRLPKTDTVIAAYRDACAEEAPNDAAFMLKASGTVARTRYISQLAEQAGMTRAGLHKALPGGGNPSLETTMKVAMALGYRLAVLPDRD